MNDIRFYERLVLVVFWPMYFSPSGHCIFRRMTVHFHPWPFTLAQYRRYLEMHQKAGEGEFFIFPRNAPKFEKINFVFLFCFQPGHVIFLEMSCFPIFKLGWENGAFQDQILLADDIQNKSCITCKFCAYRIIIFADNHHFLS